MNNKVKTSLMLFWMKQLHKIAPGARIVVPIDDNGMKKYSFEKLDIVDAIIRIANKG